MEITEDDSLLELSTISSTEKELLAAVNITKVYQLKNHTPEFLSEALSEVNRTLKIQPLSITSENVRSWLPERFFLLVKKANPLQKSKTLSLKKEIHFAPLAHTVSLRTLQEAGVDTEKIPIVGEVEEGDEFICCVEENRPVSKDLNESIDQILGYQ